MSLPICHTKGLMILILGLPFIVIAALVSPVLVPYSIKVSGGRSDRVIRLKAPAVAHPKNRKMSVEAFSLGNSGFSGTTAQPGIFSKPQNRNFPLNANNIVVMALGSVGNSGSCQFISNIPLKCVLGGFKSRRNTVACHNSENDENITEQDILDCSSTIDNLKLGLAEAAITQLLSLWVATSGLNNLHKSFDFNKIKSTLGSRVEMLDRKLFISEVILSEIIMKTKNEFAKLFQGSKMSLPLDDSISFENEGDDFMNDFKNAKSKLVKTDLGFLDVKNYLIFQCDEEFIKDAYVLLEQAKVIKRNRRELDWNLKQYINNLNWKYAIDKKEFMIYVKNKLRDLVEYARHTQKQDKHGIGQPLDLEELETLLLQIEQFAYPEWIFEVYESLCARRINTIINLNRYIKPKSVVSPTKRDSEFEDLPLPLLTWKLIYHFLMICSYVAALLPSVIGALFLQLLPVIIFATLNLIPIFGFNPVKNAVDFGVNFKELIAGMAPETFPGVLAERIATKHPGVRY